MVFTWLNVGILVFLVAGLLFGAGPLLGSLLFAPRMSGGDARMPYECGMTPHGSSWKQFGVNYYVYALLFLAFDVDVLYLFPVAAWYRDSQGWLPFVKIFLFLFILAVGVVYFWRKGVFSWPRRIMQ